MVNEHTPISRPKNLDLLSNNSPKENNDLLINDGAKFDDTFFSSLSSEFRLGVRSPTLMQSAQSFSTYSSFSNLNNLSPSNNFGQPLSNNLLPSNTQNRPLWGSLSRSAQNQTSSSSLFNDMFGRQTTNLFSDLADNQVKSNSVGEIGSGLTNGQIHNKNDSPFEASQFTKSQSDSKDIWLQGKSHTSTNIFMNGHNDDLFNPDKNTPNSTTKSSLNLQSSMLWPITSPDQITVSPGTWGPPADNTNSENGLEEKDKMDAGGFELITKLLNSENNNGSLTSWPDQRCKNLGSSMKKIFGIFEQHIQTMLHRDLELCQDNFKIFSDMLKKDLKKFDASTFTIEELHLFQKIYSSFNESCESFEQEKGSLKDHLDLFSYALQSIENSTTAGSTIATKDINNIENKITNIFNVLYSAKYNNCFLNFVNFYRGIIYSVPNDILNNLPLISELSKLVNTNNGNPADPLFMAYRNLIDELDKYNNKPQVDSFLEHQHLKPSSQDDPILNGDIDSNFTTETSNTESNNKDIEHLNYLQQMIENEMDLSSLTISRQSSFSSNVPPVFSHINHLKVEPSVYMPHYYPVCHSMLNLQGPIVAFATKIRPKNNAAYYMSPNRHTLEIIVETELSKSFSGQVVFEKSEYLLSNKSFNKLVARVKKHFPNLPIKQLVELVIQSKYAIMKKYHTQYGFSGFKIKDLVRYIVEHICDIANPNINISYDSTKDKKGVSWSKVASISSHSNAPMISPSLSSVKDNSSVTSNSSYSPSLTTPQSCAYCKSPVSDHLESDDGKKMALLSCTHVIHIQCINIASKAKVKPTCPLCDQFNLRNEEFPSL